MKTKFLALSLALIGMLAVNSCTKEYTVKVNSNNEAWGTVTGGGTYASGATATLAAVPSTDCFFVKWNDDITDNPRTVTVTKDITYTAYFAEKSGGNFSFSGKVQKGPFVTGATITVNELNENLGQTGCSLAMASILMRCLVNSRRHKLPCKPSLT